MAAKDSKTPAREFTDADLTKIVSAVTATIRKGEVVKADPGKETSAESTPTGSSAAPPPPVDAGPPPPGDAPPPADAGGGMDPGAGAPADVPDPTADQGTSPEQLQAEFESMPPEEFDAWFQLISAAKAKRDASGAGGDPGADMGAGPPGDAPPPAADASAGPPAEKAEVNPANGGKMSKSEVAGFQAQLSQMQAQLTKLTTDNAAKDATIKKMEASVATAERVVGALESAAAREEVRGKAVTSVSSDIGSKGAVLTKAEQLRGLSRDDVNARLGEIMKSERKLSKADYRAIVRFNTIPSTPINEVAHLLISPA